MKLVSLIAAASLAMVAGVASAKIEIDGSATQEATIKNGAVVNLGLGDATQKINNVEGKDIHIGGKLQQKLSVENGALVNLGLGNATQKVNNIEQK